MRPQDFICGLMLIFALFLPGKGWAKVEKSRVIALLDEEGLASFETAAAGPDVSEPGTSTRPWGLYDSTLIRKIQKGLADQGFFFGIIDGEYGPRTEAAIRAYQKSAELPITGIPDGNLALDLETGGKVGQLLKRLEKTRRQGTDAARTALLSRPETRHLVDQIQESDDQTPFDKKTCMANPNPKCLLIDAANNAGDIEKPEMRDWALGEILTAQAKAGLAKDALSTTRRIHDPRLIMVALRDIAKAQALGGYVDEAIAAVAIIPDLEQQVEAFVAIAEIQANQGQLKQVEKTASHMVTYLQQLEKQITKIQFHTRIATIVYTAGNPDLAKIHIRAAESLSIGITAGKERDDSLRHIAGAYAETGNPTKALSVLKQVKQGSGNIPVLISAATSLAQAGEVRDALVTADTIETVRYRALVFARIASYQAGVGQLVEAKAALAKAQEDAEQIRFPFAKAYAFSRIALSLNDVSISAGNDPALLNEALDTTDKIKDARLKAHILWTIADERRFAGDHAGALIAQDRSITATDDIKVPFSRVWMLCDVALNRASHRDMDQAWATFGDALAEAKTIQHPWGRARALSKVASTMTTLLDATASLANAQAAQ